MESAWKKKGRCHKLELLWKALIEKDNNAQDRSHLLLVKVIIEQFNVKRRESLTTHLWCFLAAIKYRLMPLQHDLFLQDCEHPFEPWRSVRLQRVSCPWVSSSNMSRVLWPGLKGASWHWWSAGISSSRQFSASPWVLFGKLGCQSQLMESVCSVSRSSGYFQLILLGWRDLCHHMSQSPWQRRWWLNLWGEFAAFSPWEADPWVSRLSHKSWETCQAATSASPLINLRGLPFPWLAI